MGNKQTAVEWLLDQLEKHNDGDNQWFSKAATKNRALRMEKEQIIDSYEYGNCDWEFGIYMKGEQYYNEKYANDTTKGLSEEDSKRRGWHY